MSAPTPKPPSLSDFDPHPATNPRRQPASRWRRPVRPAIVASVAILAVGVASAVGVAAFGSPARPTRPTASTAGRGTGSVPVAPTGTPVDTGRLAAAPAVDPPPPSDPVTASPTRPPVPSRPPSKPAPPRSSGDASAEGAVLTLVNSERAKAGCAPLDTDSRLASAARLHSADMASRGYFDHTTPDGVTFDKRITAAGYRWSNAAENIAKGQSTPAAVMQSWMNSPGHRANILNCKLKNIGVGLAYDSRNSPLWTQDFATLL